jgi:hypothetical protein
VNVGCPRRGVCCIATTTNNRSPSPNPSQYTIKKCDPVRVTFDPVTTKSLRLQMELPKDFSSGLYKWEVE